MKGKFYIKPENRPITYSVALHALLLIFFIINLDSFGASSQLVQPLGQVVKANVVNGKELAQIERRKQAAIARAKRIARQKRLAKLRAIAAKKARVRELKRLKELRIKQAKAAKLKREQARRAKALAAKRKKALAAKRKILAKKRAQAIAKQRKVDEAKAKRDAAIAAAKAQAAAKAAFERKYGAIIDRFRGMIMGALSDHWNVPSGVNKNMVTTLRIRLAPGGLVLAVNVIKSSGNAALDRSAVAAVYKSSPLPVPSRPELFNQFREMVLTVSPKNVMS